MQWWTSKCCKCGKVCLPAGCSSVRSQHCNTITLLHSNCKLRAITTRNYCHPSLRIHTYSATLHQIQVSSLLLLKSQTSNIWSNIWSNSSNAGALTQTIFQLNKHLVKFAILGSKHKFTASCFFLTLYYCFINYIISETTIISVTRLSRSDVSHWVSPS